MKNSTFTIEFVSHCLANSPNRSNDCDRFDKDSAGNLIWGFSWWYSALTRAISDNKAFKGIKANQINIDLVVKADIEEYRRRINERRYRNHEAIMPGTSVTFTAVVHDRITETVLRDLLTYTGKFIGISPFGFNIGFGRFEVVDVSVDSGVEGKK